MADLLDETGMPEFPNIEDLARNRRAILGRIEHRSRKRRRLAAAAVVTVVVLVGGAVGAPFITQWGHSGAMTAEGSSLGGQGHAQSLAEWYHSLGDLKARSAIAVQGTVTRRSSPSDAGSGFPGVDAELSIDRVLVDFGRVDEVDRGGVDAGHAVPGQKIVVRQPGDAVANGVAVVEDPPFAVAETCILFLREIEPGRYVIVGGQSGRFEVKNGQVAPAVPNGVPFSGTVDEFVAALNSSLPSPH